MTLHFLVADSEGAEARAKRRASVGQSAGESFVAFLGRLVPDAESELATPADGDAPTWSADALARFDAVFLTGSPLHIYDGSPEAAREIAFMRAVFASGTPSFGSCAGLQVAVAAAGGSVRPAAGRREAGFARALRLTEAGASHPLLAGRPPVFDALTVHGDEVERLPDGATLLATNRNARVQAAEIRHDRGVFWGVQYHPELTLTEVAAALRRDADTLIEEGLVRTGDDVEQQAALMEELSREPDRADLHWRLGVDDEVARDELRSREVRNFVEFLVQGRSVGEG